jgi:hypothetical protein
MLLILNGILLTHILNTSQHQREYRKGTGGNLPYCKGLFKLAASQREGISPLPAFLAGGKVK